MAGGPKNVNDYVNVLLEGRPKEYARSFSAAFSDYSLNQLDSDAWKILKEYPLNDSAISGIILRMLQDDDHNLDNDLAAKVSYESFDPEVKINFIHIGDLQISESRVLEFYVERSQISSPFHKWEIVFQEKANEA